MRRRGEVGAGQLSAPNAVRRGERTFGPASTQSSTSPGWTENLARGVLEMCDTGWADRSGPDSADAEYQAYKRKPM